MSLNDDCDDDLCYDDDDDDDDAQLLGTFRSRDKEVNEYSFSILSMRIRFGGRRGRHVSKCACSGRKVGTLSRRRPMI